MGLGEIRSRPRPRPNLGVVFDLPKGRLDGVVGEEAEDERLHWVFVGGHKDERFI